MQLPQRLHVLSLLIDTDLMTEMYKSSLQSCSCWFGPCLRRESGTPAVTCFWKVPRSVLTCIGHECPGAERWQGRATAEGAAASLGSAGLRLRRGGEHTEISASRARCWASGSVSLLNEMHEWHQLQQMGLCGVHSGVSFQSSVD